jgi:CDP-2,3-bis-(O-geranylgeranyl)-sn-glycerol synthase
MQPMLILALLVLLFVANGTPVVVKRVLGERFAFPLDGGIGFVDGRRLFGPAKTIRGIVLSVVVTAAAAPLVGLDWMIGILVGSAAMVGDIFSSFLKRRLGLAASSRATGIDQLPETLFPLLVCRDALALTVADITVSVAIFFVGEIVLSPLFFRLRVRDRPY